MELYNQKGEEEMELSKQKEGKWNFIIKKEKKWNFPNKKRGNRTFQTKRRENGGKMEFSQRTNRGEMELYYQKGEEMELSKQKRGNGTF